MTTPTTLRFLQRERWTKLPEWAQTELNLLIREVQALSARLADGPESNTWTHHRGVQRPIGTDPDIVRKNPDGTMTVVTFHDDLIEIYHKGGAQLAALTGGATNVLRVKPIDG